MEISSSDLLMGAIIAPVISVIGFFIVRWMHNIESRLKSLEDGVEKLVNDFIRIESQLKHISDNFINKVECIDNKNTLLQKIAVVSHRIRVLELGMGMKRYVRNDTSKLSIMNILEEDDEDHNEDR